MNTCGQGCGLPLKRGAVHLNLESCISALKEELEKATPTCTECGGPVETVVHPGCVHRLLSKRGLDKALNAAEKKLVEKVTDFFTGKPSNPPEDDAPPRRDGRRWRGR